MDIATTGGYLMKLKYPINIHKGLTAPVVLAMMASYQNFSITPWIYLALHGGYGLLWLCKDQLYPDKRWDEEVPIALGLSTFVLLGSYWVAPWLLISRGVQPANFIIAIAIFLNLLGVFLHYTSDAQKHFTLQYRPGLITEGFFARCRNTNYLGELLIYGSFALLSMHWLPFVILAGFAVGVFFPGMRQKDVSLSRYPEFESYKRRSGFLLPKLGGAVEPADPLRSHL
jgi:protein-S-isoprenylcysteine O-methyltransferase Ste14